MSYLDTKWSNTQSCYFGQHWQSLQEKKKHLEYQSLRSFNFIGRKIYHLWLQQKKAEANARKRIQDMHRALKI
jgi:hypothetical protein